MVISLLHYMFSRVYITAISLFDVAKIQHLFLIQVSFATLSAEYGKSQVSVRSQNGLSPIPARYLPDT